jgi:phosphoglycolate phosphatase-like HAD superfamily hydrolase
MPMPIIDAILFEPVGCLAEFCREEFQEMALQVFGRPSPPGMTASGAYWHLLNLMAAADTGAQAGASFDRAVVEGFELDAVRRARPYEDVAPSLAELKALGVALIVASSLSTVAIASFLETRSLRRYFIDVWTRDTAGGVRHVPLAKALADRGLDPARVMFVTDTADGLETAKQVGVNSVLMMNDPDEAMKLTEHNPAGGIVSLHELPDFVRLVSAENEHFGAR